MDIPFFFSTKKLWKKPTLAVDKNHYMETAFTSMILSSVCYYSVYLYYNEDNCFNSRPLLSIIAYATIFTAFHRVESTLNAIYGLRGCIRKLSIPDVVLQFRLIYASI